MVGSAPANIERLDALAPSPAGDFWVADRTPVFEEEEVLMPVLPAETYSARSAKWRFRTSRARGQSSTSRSSSVLVRSLSRRLRYTFTTTEVRIAPSTGSFTLSRPKSIARRSDSPTIESIATASQAPIGSE
jgi:hypothetical protein